MASSLRNLARRNVPQAQPEPEPPSVTEEAPPVAKEPETVVTPPETESVSEGHVVQPKPTVEEDPGITGEVEEQVTEIAPPAPKVVKSSVTTSSKKKKAQKVATTGEASTDEKKEAEAK